MSETTPPDSNKPGRPVTIGRVTMKKRQELDRLKEEQRRIQQVYREEKAKLERDLAESDRRDRRRESLARHNDDKRMRFILGGVILEVLRQQGTTAFSFGPMDLTRMKVADRTSLEGILARLIPTPPSPASQPIQDAPSNDSGVDLPL